ncbi:MAG TPA: hypothetical protein VFH93_08650 [Thermoleophilia bacterium]|nr:hypothetical protein [Thermoleophilia bacterium]
MAAARKALRRIGYHVDAYDLGSKHRPYAQDLERVKRLPKGVPPQSVSPSSSTSPPASASAAPAR